MVSAEQANTDQQAYTVEQDVLMRQWSPSDAEGSDWDKIKQIVMPTMYRR